MEGIPVINLLIEKVDNGYIVRENAEQRHPAEFATASKTKVFESLGTFKKYLDEEFNIDDK